jgi:anti-sigma factor RsiW
MTCRELTEVVTDYVEGVMPAEDRARLEAHLELCAGCADYVRQMELTIKAVGRVEPEEVEATASDELLAMFRSWKRGDPLPET